LGAWCARLKDMGKTVLLTTHYLDEAQSLSDRVAIVKNGVVVRRRAARANSAWAPIATTVAYDQNGGRVELETDDPTELAAPSDQRGDPARRAAAGPDRQPSPRSRRSTFS